MTVSIVIPCYNYGRYLAEAIESALAQTWPADEIVIIDDGSTDDSLAVARRYEGRPGVRVIAQANQGAVAACNNGIRASQGTFFLRLDADDRLDPQYLQLTVPVLAAHSEAGYVYTAYQYFGVRHEVLRAQVYDAKRLAFRPYILGTTLIRRAAFDATGGYSEAMRGAYEDWDFYLSLAEHGWQGHPLDTVLYFYRQHPGSRNGMSFRKWVSLMGILYERHRGLHSVPRDIYLGVAVLDRAFVRFSKVGLRLVKILSMPFDARFD